MSDAAPKTPVIIPAKSVLRRWSFWLGTSGAVLFNYLAFLPTQAYSVWQGLPPSVTHHIPADTAAHVGAILSALASGAMWIHQPAVWAKVTGLFARLKSWGASGAVEPKRATLIGIVGAAAAGIIMSATPRLEGWRNDPYRDIGGIWTVCAGHTGPDVKPGVRVSDAECRARLDRDTQRFAGGVLTCVPQLQGRPYQTAASVIFAYNIGLRGFCTSTAARRFRAGDWRGGCEAFKMWNKVNGRVSTGLVNRRAAEVQICETGLD